MSLPAVGLHTCPDVGQGKHWAVIKKNETIHQTAAVSVYFCRQMPSQPWWLYLVFLYTNAISPKQAPTKMKIKKAEIWNNKNVQTTAVSSCSIMHATQIMFSCDRTWLIVTGVVFLWLHMTDCDWCCFHVTAHDWLWLVLLACMTYKLIV